MLKKPPGNGPPITVAVKVYVLSTETFSFSHIEVFTLTFLIFYSSVLLVGEPCVFLVVIYEFEVSTFSVHWLSSAY